MKTNITLFFFFIVTLSTAQAVAEKKPVHAAVVSFFKSIADLDHEAMRSAVTDDFMLIEDGSVSNADTLAASIKKMQAKRFKRSDRLKFIRTQIDGNTAWVAYHNEAEITIDDKLYSINWLESAVLVRRDGKWLVALLHSSELKPDKK